MNENREQPEDNTLEDWPHKLERSIIYGIATVLILCLQVHFFLGLGFRVSGPLLPGFYFVLFIPALHALISTSMKANELVSVITTIALYWITAILVAIFRGYEMRAAQQYFFLGLLISPLFYSTIIYSIYQWPKLFK